MSEHSNARAVGDRLRIRARHCWIACVVEQNEFNRPSVDATLGVHLVDCKLRRDQAFCPGRGGRARERISERDANRLRARPEDGGPSTRATPATTASHTMGRCFIVDPCIDRHQPRFSRSRPPRLPPPRAFFKPAPSPPPRSTTLKADEGKLRGAESPGRRPWPRSFTYPA